MNLNVSEEFAKLLEIVKDEDCVFQKRATAFNYIMYCMEEDASMIMFAYLGLQPNFVSEEDRQEDYAELQQNVMSAINKYSEWFAFFVQAGKTFEDLKEIVEDENFFEDEE